MTSKLYTPAFIIMATANLFLVSSMGAFFLFPLFLLKSGASKTDIGILMGAMALASVICRPWIAQMVDRVGRKRGYSIGCLIMTGVSLSYLFLSGPLSNFYLPLFFIRTIHGIGLALCFTAAFTYVVDIIPEGRLNEGIGMFGTTGLMGMAVGPVVAETIIQRYGFPAYFFTGAALAGSAFLLNLPLTESYLPFSPKDAPSFFMVLRRKKIIIIAFLTMVFGVGLAASGSFVTPFGQELHLPFISLYYLSYSALAVLTRLFGGRLADHIGEERILPYALGLTGLGLLMLTFLNGTLILVVSGMVTGCGHGFLFPCLNALAVRNEPIDLRGKINGIFTGGMDAGIFTGSIFLGYVGEWAGFRAIFLAAGTALFVGLAIYKIGLQRQRPLAT